ncbi:MAG: MBOAT family protein [Alphaproteobacteria bacterium]|nr:MBOAT family protein [Alphaproteobacteria bacterium]
MLFSSLTFLFFFLPMTIIVYYTETRRIIRNMFLLFASVLFYAWGDIRYLPILFSTVFISYIGAIFIERSNHKQSTAAVFILLDLSMLFYFKYAGFFLENIGLLFHREWSLKLVLPLGISFYTFQALSYLIDVCRGGVKAQHNFFNLSLYICFFPQLIAGPIVKYHDIADQIDDRKETTDAFYYGFRRFIIGLAKKVLIANASGEIADKIFALPIAEFDAPIAWLGAMAYTFQIYYDFSGYSDMAIGLGALFGFRIPENFNYPYISKSISEFWRRWHISLGTWFKEYLFYPVSVSLMNSRAYRLIKKHFGKKTAGVFLSIVALTIVWGATGLWHGAAWTFIVWGLYNGFFILFELLTGWGKTKKSKLLSAIQHLYAVFVFVISFVIFRSESCNHALHYIQNMFGLIKEHTVYLKLPYYLNHYNILIFTLAFLFSFPIFKDILNVKNKYYQTIINIFIMIAFSLSVFELTANTFNPFIYFRF